MNLLNVKDFQFLTPEIALCLFAFIALICGAFSPKKCFLGLFSLAGVVIAYLLLPKSFLQDHALFAGMLVNDGYGQFFRQIILFISGAIILLSIGYQEIEEDNRDEYYFFLLILTASMMLAVSSNHWLMIYLTVEAISLASYVMAGYVKRDLFSSEAGVKYFLFGALSTGIMLYGISLIYGMFGTLHLDEIANLLQTQPFFTPGVLIAFVLVLVGFGFKCSLVPFHMWTPDVYQGAPTPVAALLSVGPKAVGFILLIRVFTPIATLLPIPWTALIATISIVTMTVGNIAALGQGSVKRLLAYSTIAQAGYMLMGLLVVTDVGAKALLFYIVVYTIMNLGAFAVVVACSNAFKSDTINYYAGLYKREPLMAVTLTVSLLSLAGIPPLAGFLAKFFIFAAVVEIKFYSIVIIAVMNSVIALYYYARIVKTMFLDEPTETYSVPKSPTLVLALLLFIVGIVVIGLWPSPVLSWIENVLISV